MSHFAVSGRVDELTNGTVGSVGAAMEAAIGPYWESRFMLSTLHEQFVCEVPNATPRVSTPS